MLDHEFSGKGKVSVRSPKHKYSDRFDHQRINVATADSAKENTEREKVNEAIWGGGGRP